VATRSPNSNATGASRNSGDRDRYVETADILKAVAGHEPEILNAIGINWPGGSKHITCPYPDHGGSDDWRWDDKAKRAFCSCAGRRGEPGSHSIFDVVRIKEGRDFDAAKIRIVEIMGRSDLVRTKSGAQRRQFQRIDAASLLSVPAENRDDDLPVAYLAHRLGVEPAEVPLPGTPMVGWRALPYYDPPSRNGGQPKHVGDFPCVVFGTLDVDGKTHAHRIYVAPGGAGKAQLGRTLGGKERNPKKSAKKVREDDNTSGTSVLWGDPTQAPHLILTEGIETGVAEALAYCAAIQAGEIVVAAAISANGIEDFKPWLATRRITVAADRDELWHGSKSPSKRGELAARALGMALHKQIEIRIALPGKPNTKTDWLDVLRAEGADAVRAGIETAERFVPTAHELADVETHRSRAAQLADVIKTYPLPDMETMEIRYQHTAGGRVWLHKYDCKDRETGEDLWLPVATPLGVPALLRYANQADVYGLRVLVQDMKGRPRPVDLERSALARMGGSDIKAKLFEAGLRVEQDGDHIAVALLKAAEPTHEIVVVSRPGWHRLPGLDPIFVAPSGMVFGLPEGYSLELSVNSRLAEPVVAGTLDGWRKAIEAAVTVRDCPHWIIGVIAAFAGPVLGLVGLDTCGINLSGLSSGGKTTAQKLAVSAWSSPKVGDALLQSMRTTENAVEALAQRSSGTVLALDEMAHADGKTVSRLIYSIAGGIGKARMTAAAALKDQYSWSTFAVISGECSLEEKVRQDGGQWMAGMAVRIVDVDVTAVNRAVDQAQLDAIYSVDRNYGHAGPAFLQELIASGAHRNPEALRERVNRAAQSIVEPGADSARLRAALPFGILLIAGELAKALGILPASTPVGEAVRWAWLRFTGSSDAVALNPAEQVIGNLRQWIAERWGSSIREVETVTGVRDAVAWYDADTVYLPTKRIREAAGEVLKEQHIVRILSERGLLARRHDAKRIALRTVPSVGKVDVYALRRDELGRHETNDAGVPHLRVVSDE
jgi:hypothetical protein